MRRYAFVQFFAEHVIDVSRYFDGVRSGIPLDSCSPSPDAWGRLSVVTCFIIHRGTAATTPVRSRAHYGI